MATFADLLLLLRADTSQMDPALKETRRQLSGLSTDAQSMGAALSGIGTTLTAAVTVPIVGVGAAALAMSAQLEQSTIGFTSMMGSADLAKDHLEQLRAFAATTPFEFDDVTRASQRLQALGFSASEVIPTLTAVGGAAAAMGTGAEGIDRIVLALGQMQAKGKVMSQELNQLAEAGIPAYQILAKTLNTDVAGAMKMVEDRAVSSATAVPALIKAMSDQFGEGLKAQSNSLNTLFSNLEDRFKQVLGEIGNVLAPTAKDIIAFAQEGADKLEDLAKAFADLPKPIQATTIGVAGVAAAMGPVLFVGGQLVSSVGQLASGYRSLLPYLESASGSTGLAAVATGGLAATAAIGALVILGPELVDLAKNISNFVNSFDVSALGAIPALVAAISGSIVGSIPIVNQMGSSWKDAYRWMIAVATLGTSEIPTGLHAANVALSDTKDIADSMGGAISANLDHMSDRARATGDAFDKEFAKKSASAVDETRAKIKDLDDAFKVLSVTDVSAEIGKLQTNFATMQEGARQGKVTTDELRAAQENLKLKTIELGDTLIATPLRIVGAKDSETEVRLLQEAMSFLKTQFDAGKISVDTYSSAVAGFNEKMAAITPKLDSMTAGFSKASSAIAAVVEQGVLLDLANIDVSDSMSDLEKQVRELSGSFGENVLKAGSLEEAFKSAGIRTPQQIREELKKTQDEFDRMTAAAKVGVDGAADSLEGLRDKMGKLNKELANSDPFKELGIKSQAELDDIAKKAKEAYEKIRDDSDAANRDMRGHINDTNAAFVVYVEAAKAAHQTLPDSTLADYERIKDDAKNCTTSAKGAFDDLAKQISGAFDTAMTDSVSALLSGQTDMSEIAKNLGLDLANAFLKDATNAVKGFVTDVLKGNLSGAIADLKKDVGGLLDLFDKLGGGVSAATPGIIPGPTGTPTPTVPTNVPNVPTSPPSGAASGASGGIGGALGAIGAIGSAVSAVSGIIGNFQTARLEGTMNAVEYNTRVSAIHLLHILEDGVNGWLPNLQHIKDALYNPIHGDLVGIWSTLTGIRDDYQTSPRQNVINVTVEGNVFGNDDFLDKLATEIGRRLKMNGLPA